MTPILCLLALLVLLAVAPPVEGATPPPDPAKTLAELRSEVDRLLAKPQPDLFARHLRSILALSEEGFIRLSLNAPNHDEQAIEFVQYVSTIAEGLKGDAGRAESYLSEGKRTLVLARLSKIDGSLQSAPLGSTPSMPRVLILLTVVSSSNS